MYTQKQKLLLNRSHLKKNVFVLFTVSTQEYIPRAYKYYELEECQHVFVSILYDIKFMYLVCSWPNMLTFITVVGESYRGQCRMWYLLITYNPCHVRSATNLAHYTKICIIDRYLNYDHEINISTLSIIWHKNNNNWINWYSWREYFWDSWIIL